VPKISTKAPKDVFDTLPRAAGFKHLQNLVTT